ncbi:hypothetical protein [Lacrimispora sp.]|nr:hypothetical protein [Lacrimispora sp.]MDR7812943.1 hypothetical protein [Lacrimispora sp.]
MKISNSGLLNLDYMYDKDHFVRQGAGQPIPAMIEVIHLIL